jgi:uncharacterized protein
MKWQFDPADVVPLALGAAVLGTGGGGDPYVGQLTLQREIERNGPPWVVDLADLDDEALVVPVAMGGAPVVGLEKLLSDSFADVSVRRLEQYLGRKVDAIIPLEIGGVNSLLPLVAASRLGVPVVDADGMGRAFPTLDKTTFSIFGLSASPVVTSNEHGDGAIIQCHTNQRAELVSRAVLVQLGAACSSVLFPMSGRDAKRTAIGGTVSLALRVGRAMRDARRYGHNSAQAIILCLLESDAATHARIVFTGKIADVERSMSGGFNSGRGRLLGMEGWKGEVEFSFQNEFTRIASGERLLAIVPDLICFIDAATGDPITCETLRYGQRVTVLGISCAPILRSTAGLAACGPAAFGLTDTYRPVEELAGGTEHQPPFDGKRNP